MTVAPEVERAKLEPLHKAGEGGQGIVYLTDATKINNLWPVAVKEYLPETRFDPGRLREMAALVPALDAATGRWLCETTAWPAVLVAQQGKTTGFLMRRIPDSFYRPWGDKGAREPAALKYLLNPEQYLNRRGIGITYPQRVQLLLNLADTMARLHGNGIVIGDISPNNILVDLSAEPRCFLIDCDGMRLRGADVLHQVETPEWQVPDGEPVATEASDAYKFALLVIRMFAQDQMGRDLRAIEQLNPQLAALARRGIARDSTARPGPAQWLSALRAAAAAPSPGPIPPVQSPAQPSNPTTGTTRPPAQPGPVPVAAKSGNKTVAALATVLAIIVLIVIIASCHDNSSQGQAPSGTTTAVTETTDVTPVQDTQTTDVATDETNPPDPVIGDVDYSAVQDDSAAETVAQMFADYLDAINNRDWEAALAAYDPAGIVKTGNPTARRNFIHDVSTTHDSDATIRSFDGTTEPALAELTFRSTQKAGFGPLHRKNETCTDWRITYRLTGGSSGAYQIFNAVNASSSPC